MVRRLRWAEVREPIRWWYDPEEDDEHEPIDVPGQVQAFLRLTRTLANLTAAEARDLPFPAYHQFFRTLSSSPSLATISSLSLHGAVPGPLEEDEVTAVDILRVLQALPALRSLNFALLRLQPLPPSYNPAERGALTLTDVTFGAVGRGLPNDQPVGPFFPFSPCTPLVLAIDPSSLTSAQVFTDQRARSWLRWVGNPAFTALRSLTIQDCTSDVPELFPLATASLHQLPHLLHLRFRLTTILGLPDPCEVDLVHLRPFLFNLPSSLHRLDLDFVCQLDLAYEDPVRDLLQSRQYKELRWFRCRTQRIPRKYLFVCELDPAGGGIKETLVDTYW